MRRRKRARLGLIAAPPDPRVFYLASYPRSGNTMARILLHHYFGVDTRSIYPGDGRHFSGKHTSGIRERNAAAPLIAVKTHLGIRSNPGIPALVVVRDGRDAIVSYAHYLRAFEGRPTPANALMLGLAGPGAAPTVNTSWSGFHGYWLDRHQGPVSILRYEDMVADPCSAVSGALRLLYPEAVQITAEQPPTFAELSRENPKFFRRGIVGSWKTELPKTALDTFMSWHGEMLRRLGYAA